MAQPSPKKTETALAKTTNTQFMALVSKDRLEMMQQTIAETMGGELSVFSLDEVKLPGAGGLTWKVPTFEGTQQQETLEGVIVYVQKARALYVGEFTGENAPPLCSSPDGVCGYGEPGGLCKDCPLSQWGSKVMPNGSQGKGSACAERKHILLLPEDSLLPLFLDLPVTSVKAAEKHFMRIGGKGLLWTQVVTRIGLEEAKSGGGITYSQATFAAAGVLSPEQAELAEAYKNAIGPLVRSRMVADAKSRASNEPADVEPE